MSADLIQTYLRYANLEPFDVGKWCFLTDSPRSAALIDQGVEHAIELAKRSHIDERHLTGSLEAAIALLNLVLNKSPSLVGIQAAPKDHVLARAAKCVEAIEFE